VWRRKRKEEERKIEDDMWAPIVRHLIHTKQ
jgi:hypothetical protein